MERSHADHFERILDQHGPWLLLLARSLSIQDAETAVHDAFVALWERIAAGAVIEHPGAYLATIVRNAATRAARSRLTRLDPRTIETWITVQPPDPSSVIDDDEQIASWLAGLPAEQREVVVLKIWAGLTFEHIGMALGVSINTAASRYRYALVRLKDLAARSKDHDERTTRSRSTRHE